MKILGFIALIFASLVFRDQCWSSETAWKQFSIPYFKEAKGSPDRLSIPNLETRVRGKYFLDHQGEVGQCQFLVSAASGLIKSANARYPRRGWHDVLGELLQVAQKYSDRSQYIGLRLNGAHLPLDKEPVRLTPLDHDDPAFADTYLATIGITYAKYENAAQEGLPLEDFLKTSLDRPMTSKKRGIIFELRTFSKDKVKAADAFPELFLSATAMVFRSLRDYPDLYDQDVIYTYADFETIDGSKLPGVRLYEGMGFEVDKSQGVFEFEGSRWRVLHTSPKKMEALIFKFKGIRLIDGLNQPHPITLPSGIKTFAAPHHLIQVDDEEVAFGFTTTEQLEVAPGIFAAPGATVRYEQNTYRFVGVTKLAKPAHSRSRHEMIPEGKGIYIRSDGDPAEWIDPDIR